MHTACQGNCHATKSTPNQTFTQTQQPHQDSPPNTTTETYDHHPTHESSIMFYRFYQFGRIVFTHPIKQTTHSSNQETHTRNPHEINPSAQVGTRKCAQLSSKRNKSCRRSNKQSETSPSSANSQISPLFRLSRKPYCASESRDSQSWRKDRKKENRRRWSVKTKSNKGNNTFHVHQRVSLIYSSQSARGFETPAAS